jgi:hypothetical protein
LESEQLAIQEGVHCVAVESVILGSILPASSSQPSGCWTTTLLHCATGPLYINPDFTTTSIMSCLTHTIMMMEGSSPLASMRAGPFQATYGSQADSLVFGSGAMLAPPNFNFKDLSMKKAPSNYFNAKPMTGSSPGTTLAADLSQNWHIGQRYG